MRRTLATVCAALALAAVGQTASAATPPERPVSLVVALGLADPSLQAGVVRGRDVILARGFEVELARVLARRLGGRVDRFVHAPAAGRLLASGTADWQLAFAAIERRTDGSPSGPLSVPYLTTDAAVVTRRGLARPRGLSDLRGALVCAVRGGAGMRAARAARLGPDVLAPTGERLRSLVRTGACDAALVPAAEVGRFVAGQRRLLGPVVGRVRHGAGLAAVVRGDAGVDVIAVNRELVRVRRDGTLGRLARTWLGLDPASLRVLR